MPKWPMKTWLRSLSEYLLVRGLLVGLWAAVYFGIEWGGSASDPHFRGLWEGVICSLTYFGMRPLVERLVGCKRSKR